MAGPNGPADHNEISQAIPVRVVPVEFDGVTLAAGGGAGGGAVTIADNGDFAQGSVADAAWTSGNGTVIALLKKIASAGGSAVSIADGSDVATGTTTDADTALTVIGRLKKIVALLTGTLTVGGTVAVSNFTDAGLTDTQLRATAVPVSGPLTDTQLRAVAVPVSGTVTASGPLTDAELRAVAVPVSGTVTVTSTAITATVTPAGDDVVADGRDVVTTAGTRVQMQAQACKVVAVTAETDNTGLVVVGSVTCVAAIATRRGLPLSAGDTAIFSVDNVNRLYLDSTVNGDGVTWAVLS